LTDFYGEVGVMLRKAHAPFHTFMNDSQFVVSPSVSNVK